MPAPVTAPADRVAAASPWCVPVAVALAAAGLGWHEARLRADGFLPGVTDCDGLRGWHLDRATGDAVVLAGGSRMQLGFCPATFAAERPGRTLANLAQNGSAGTAVLERLAADETFRGTVLLDFSCHHMDPPVLDAARRWVARAAAAGPGAKFAARLHAAAAGRFAFVDAGPGWRRRVELRTDGRVPTPYYVRMLPDRSRPADYVDLDRRGGLKRVRAGRVARLTASTPPARADRPAWRHQLRPLREWVTAIQGRGGRVVFVRFPTTGPHWRHDRRRYPRKHFWDDLAALTGAETLHFGDVPALQNFDCPDTSHLDRRDAPRFTAALLDELGRRGAL